MNDILKRIVSPIRSLASAAQPVGTGGPPVEHSMIFKAANLVAAEKVEGDYLEFGVYSGGSFIYSYNVLKSVFAPRQKPNGPERTEKDKAEINLMWSGMRFFAFDSFQGLPEPTGIDKESKDFVEGKYQCTEETFRRNLRSAGVPLPKVELVIGPFEQTCTEETVRKFGMKKAAIIHVDCDLYASAKLALDFITPLLTDGSIIIFDDWYCFRGSPDLGEQRAFNEWTTTMPDWRFIQYQKEGPWGNSFIASRRTVTSPQADMPINGRNKE